MKPHLDIDVTDPRKLTKARDELRRLLEIVEFALTKYTAPQHRNGQAEFIATISDGSNYGTGVDVNGVIAKMPSAFTTSDVIVALGTEGKENRNRVKIALKKALDEG